MTFVDTNVFVFAIGRSHPLRSVATSALARGAEGELFATSSEVIQELLHLYLRRGEVERFDDAQRLVAGCVAEVWPVDRAAVMQARALADVHTGLSARDLVHLACCQLRGARRLLTFDRALLAAASDSLESASGERTGTN